MLNCEYPHDQIHVYKNMIDCGDILSIIEKDEGTIFSKWQTWFPSGAEGNETFAFGYQKKMSDHINERNSTEENNLYWSIFDSIKIASEDYAKIHNLEIGRLAPLSISKYKAGASMGKHTDSNGNIGPQTISVVCYLNDDYIGGEIRFEDQNITIKPEAGSIVIFPSKPPFFHQSMPVVSGWKYISPGFWNNLE